MVDHLLLLAGPADRDAALVAEVAARRPRRVTIAIEAPVHAAAGSDRLATLLTAIERATGATVAGLLGDPRQLDGCAFDTVVGGRGLLSAA